MSFSQAEASAAAKNLGGSLNDWFVAGDSGAGYLNPGNLTPPRAHSGLSSGLAAWERQIVHDFQEIEVVLLEMAEVGLDACRTTLLCTGEMVPATDRRPIRTLSA